MRNGRPASVHFDFALLLDFVDVVAEQARDMGRIERRGDRHHGMRVGNAVRRGEHGGAAEAVADQNGRRADRRPQMIGGGDQIVDIRRKSGVGELAFAGAEPGEIEAQHGDAAQFQALRNQPRRLDVLAAGEAMREQRDGADRPLRPVEQRGKCSPCGLGKSKRSAGIGDSCCSVSLLAAQASVPTSLHRDGESGETRRSIVTARPRSFSPRAGRSTGGLRPPSFYSRTPMRSIGYG